MTHIKTPTPILTSGGAEGADLAFEKAALEARHQVFACSFKGHKTQSTCAQVISDQQLELAAPIVREVAFMIHKQVPTSPYVKSLIYRNYFQIRRAEAVFAVAPLTLDFKNVEGGTGWAIGMAKHLSLPIYVFDESKPGDTWWVYNYETGCFDSLDEQTLPLYTRYAGIGHRKLTPKGEQAIQSLYHMWAGQVPLAPGQD